MIKKVETCWVGVHEGKNHGFRFFFTFLLASIIEHHQTCKKGVLECFTTSYRISSENIDRKILFVKKVKISTRGLR